MLRDMVIFFAGVAFLHTISHLMLPRFVTFPFQVGTFMTLTSTENVWIVVASAIVTILLLFWAKKLKA